MPRGFRIHVDDCLTAHPVSSTKDPDEAGMCPFMREHACWHPKIVFEDGVGRALPMPIPLTPPVWCPLRGSVTMIAGPRMGSCPKGEA